VRKCTFPRDSWVWSNVSHSIHPEYPITDQSNKHLLMNYNRFAYSIGGHHRSMKSIRHPDANQMDKVAKFRCLSPARSGLSQIRDMIWMTIATQASKLRTVQ
jgi:hypothetical protein